jgi:hypothetical protein
MKILLRIKVPFRIADDLGLFSKPSWCSPGVFSMASVEMAMLLFAHNILPLQYLFQLDHIHVEILDTTPDFSLVHVLLQRRETCFAADSKFTAVEFILRRNCMASPQHSKRHSIKKKAIKSTDGRSFMPQLHTVMASQSITELANSAAANTVKYSDYLTSMACHFLHMTRHLARLVLSLRRKSLQLVKLPLTLPISCMSFS